MNKLTTLYREFRKTIHNNKSKESGFQKKNKLFYR